MTQHVTMDTYLLLLLVTVEQEEAIKELFQYRGWKFIHKGKRLPPWEVENSFSDETKTETTEEQEKPECEQEQLREGDIDENKHTSHAEVLKTENINNLEVVKVANLDEAPQSDDDNDDDNKCDDVSEEEMYVDVSKVPEQMRSHENFHVFQADEIKEDSDEAEGGQNSDASFSDSTSEMLMQSRRGQTKRMKTNDTNVRRTDLKCETKTQSDSKPMRRKARNAATKLQPDKRKHKYSRRGKVVKDDEDWSPTCTSENCCEVCGQEFVFMSSLKKHKKLGNCRKLRKKRQRCKLTLSSSVPGKDSGGGNAVKLDLVSEQGPDIIGALSALSKEKKIHGLDLVTVLSEAMNDPELKHSKKRSSEMVTDEQEPKDSMLQESEDGDTGSNEGPLERKKKKGRTVWLNTCSVCQTKFSTNKELRDHRQFSNKECLETRRKNMLHLQNLEETNNQRCTQDSGYQSTSLSDTQQQSEQDFGVGRSRSFGAQHVATGFGLEFGNLQQANTQPHPDWNFGDTLLTSPGTIGPNFQTNKEITDPGSKTTVSAKMDDDDTENRSEVVSQSSDVLRQRKGNKGKGEKDQYMKRRVHQQAHGEKKRTWKQKKMLASLGPSKKWPNRRFHCKECDRYFAKESSLDTHKRDGKCVFECEYCSKIYISQYYTNYIKHLASHTNEKTVQCSVCHKLLKDHSTLVVHMRGHTGERPFECRDCGKGFTSSGALVTHRKVNHEARIKIQCELCGKELMSKGGLMMHKQMVHSEGRPFECKICNTSYKTKQCLRTHNKVHRPETLKFQCDICSKMFRQSGALKDHRARHTKSYRHFCEECGKGFYQLKNLEEHKRTHSGEKPFKCDYCDYRCALKSNIQSHLRVHGLGKFAKNTTNLSTFANNTTNLSTFSYYN